MLIKHARVNPRALITNIVCFWFLLAYPMLIEIRWHRRWPSCFWWRVLSLHVLRSQVFCRQVIRGSGLCCHISLETAPDGLCPHICCRSVFWWIFVTRHAWFCSGLCSGLIFVRHGSLHGLIFVRHGLIFVSWFSCAGFSSARIPMQFQHAR